MMGSESQSALRDVTNRYSGVLMSGTLTCDGVISSFRHDAVQNGHQLSCDVTMAQNDVTVHGERADGSGQAQRLRRRRLSEAALPYLEIMRTSFVRTCKHDFNRKRVI